jgi:hypothetical protein
MKYVQMLKRWQKKNLSGQMNDVVFDDIRVISVDVINDALSVIDEALSQMVKRELVSTSEVINFLLDIRNLLTADILGADMVKSFAQLSL